MKSSVRREPNDGEEQEGSEGERERRDGGS